MKSIQKASKSEWETQLLQLPELEEARARAVQMEKTMRWWSDCTANWREKWSKVRHERNMAREEVKLLQNKLDYALKVNCSYQREKHNLEMLNERMRKELEQIRLLFFKNIDKWNSQLLESVNKFVSSSDNDSYSKCADVSTIEMNSKDSGIEEYVLNEGPLSKHAIEMLSDPHFDDTPPTGYEINSDDSLNGEIYQRFFQLQLKLDEMMKTVSVEQKENNNLQKIIEKLETEIIKLKEKYEDMKASKNDTVMELLQLKDVHTDIVTHVKTDLLHETSFREDIDRRLADVRAQVERLQVENASEWGKRERLETEKLSIERENKKLRTEIKDALDRLDKRMKSQPSADNELRTLQIELADKNKELSDLKQSYNKLKKSLNDKSNEANHLSRRIEQYEAEVKKLRNRIEELKKDLANAEDEIDTHNNSVRRLQRANDDLQEQADNLHMQVNYLQNRLNRHTTSISKVQNGLSDEPTDEEETNS